MYRLAYFCRRTTGRGQYECAHRPSVLTALIGRHARLKHSGDQLRYLEIRFSNAIQIWRFNTG